jgi:hypothetical protein
VVLSKGCEVVGLGYSRVIVIVAKVTDKRENSGKHGRVDRVSKTELHYPSWVNRVSPKRSTDRWTDRVSQNSTMNRQAGWAGRVG